MDVLTLSRIQFGATIAFHYIYPPLSIGLGIILVIMEGLWLKTKNPLYHQMARFWTKVFALTFAVGVATGIVMEFEFGTNWADAYSRFVGDIFGSALSQREGIFCFFFLSPVFSPFCFSVGTRSDQSCTFSPPAWSLSAHISAPSGSSWRIPGCKRPPDITSSEKACTPGRKLQTFWAMVFNPSFPSTACFTPFAARGPVPRHSLVVSVRPMPFKLPVNEDTLKVCPGAAFSNAGPLSSPERKIFAEGYCASRRTPEVAAISRCMSSFGLASARGRVKTLTLLKPSHRPAMRQSVRRIF